jgi:hypothetical protein
MLISFFFRGVVIPRFNHVLDMTNLAMRGFDLSDRTFVGVTGNIEYRTLNSELRKSSLGSDEPIVALKSGRCVRVDELQRAGGIGDDRADEQPICGSEIRAGFCWAL